VDGREGEARKGRQCAGGKKGFRGRFFAEGGKKESTASWSGGKAEKGGGGRKADPRRGKRGEEKNTVSAAKERRLKTQSCGHRKSRRREKDLENFWTTSEQRKRFGPDFLDARGDTRNRTH